MEIFKLFGSILIDSDEADKSLAKTDKSAASVASTLGKGVATAGKWAAGIATAAAGAGAAINGLINDTADYADTIDKSSFRSSLGAENLQRLKYAAEQSGASLETVEKSAKKVNDRLAEVSEGNTKTIEMFDKLGVAVYDADGQIRSTDDVYNDTMLKLADMGDTAKATAIGTDLFGKAFVDLKPMLAAGSDGITGLMDNADKLGIVMSQDAVTAGVVYGDTIADVKAALSGAARSIGSAVLPVFQRFADKLITYIPKIEGFLKKIIPVIEQFADKLMVPLEAMIDELLPPLIDLVTALIDPIADIAAQIIPMITQLLQKLVPVATKIISKILPPLIDILDALMPLFDTALKILDPILDLVLALIDPIADVLKALQPIIDKVVELIDKALQPLCGALDGTSSVLTDVLGGALDIVCTLLTDVFLPLLSGVIDFLNGDFLGGVSRFGDAFCNAFSDALGFIDGIFGTNLQKWYDDTRAFFTELGGNLYEMTHGDEIQMVELATKYTDMQSDMSRYIVEQLRSGTEADAALQAAKNKFLDTSEKVYYFDNALNDLLSPETVQGWKANLWDSNNTYAQGYSSLNNLSVGKSTADYYRQQGERQVPKLASGGLAYADTLAIVGDNADAATNPEVVAPLSDLTRIYTTSFDTALNGFLDKLMSRIAGVVGGGKTSLDIRVNLADGTELTRAIVDNINDLTRQDGVCVIKGV